MNGGFLSPWIAATAVFSIVLSGLLEAKTLSVSKIIGYRPGHLGFDPLGLYTIRGSFGLDQITEKITREQRNDRARMEMELCEIKHG